jgi:hypothetical protein
MNMYFNTMKRSGAMVAALAALTGLTLSCQPQDGIEEIDPGPKKSVGRHVADPMPPPDENVSTETPIETLNAPASLSAMSGEQAVRDQLAPLAASITGAGANVQFVDCTEGPCLARVNSRTLTGLRELLAGASRRMGGFTFVAREQFDPYRGHFFQADLKLTGAGAMDVPGDANELVVNFGEPAEPPEPEPTPTN